MAGWLTRTIDPNIGRHLLREEGEVIVDEVPHHWVVLIVPGLEAALGLAFFYLCLVSPANVAWVPLFVGVGLVLHAAWQAVVDHMDRFVITNMRVFRVRGVLSQTQATMPLRRILDITVEKPLLGRFLNFGHFVFESAAQEQGLRDIRYIGRPYERDKLIQQVVQRAGLRGPRAGK